MKLLNCVVILDTFSTTVATFPHNAIFDAAMGNSCHIKQGPLCRLAHLIGGEKSNTGALALK